MCLLLQYLIVVFCFYCLLQEELTGGPTCPRGNGCETRASQLGEDNANCFATPDFPFSYVDSINLPVLILFSCLYHCFKRILSEKPGFVSSLGASNLFYSLMRALYTPRVLTRGAVVHCLFFAVDYFCNFHCIAHHA